MRVLRIDEKSPYQRIVGVGGIGSGIFFALDGNRTLGRSESRAAELLPVRDYCKLHIVFHYVAKLLGSGASGSHFRVMPIGNVGDDDIGRRLVQEMADTGMDVSCVRSITGKPTLFSACFQYPDGQGGNITTSNSAAAELTAADLDSQAGHVFGPNSERTIALAAPEVSLAVRHHFLQLATSVGAFRAASFVANEIKPAREAGMFTLLDLVALNESEAAELVGCHFSIEKQYECVDACLKFLRSEFPRLKMIVTLGENGAFAFADGFYNYRPALQVEIASTAGAGDSLLGGVLAAIAAGTPLLTKQDEADKMFDTGLELGVLLASYKCLSPDTIHPAASLDELVDFARTRGLRLSPALQGTSG